MRISSSSARARARHGLGRFFTGSIAERLARQSRDVPVAVVPTETKNAPVGPAFPTLRTVLAVTDFSPRSAIAAIAHAYALVRASGGVVELCHVAEHALPSPAYAYDAPGLAISELGACARAEEELRALVPVEAKSLGIATHVSIVDGGKAAEAIVQAAERLDVDVIAMASHVAAAAWRAPCSGPSRRQVVHRAHRPVYVVRTAADGTTSRRRRRPVHEQRPSQAHVLVGHAKSAIRVVAARPRRGGAGRREHLWKIGGRAPRAWTAREAETRLFRSTGPNVLASDQAARGSSAPVVARRAQSARDPARGPRDGVVLDGGRHAQGTMMVPRG